MGSTNRFVRIKKEDAKLFSYLDPYEKLRLLSLPIGFAMGVLQDTDGEVAPVGLLVAAVSEETIIIEWMAVAPEHRWRGLGEEMLYRMFMMAADAHIDTLSVAIMPEYEKERLLKGAERYFAERLFTAKHVIGGDAEISLGELRDASVIKKAPTDQPGIRTLSELTGQERRECINRLGEIDNAAYTFSPKLIATALDPDISVICKTSNTLEGGLLVCETESVLYPLYHYAKNEKISAAMIRRAAAIAERKYGPNAVLSLMLRQEGVEDLASGVLGYKTEGILLTADVNKFDTDTEE